MIVMGNTSLSQVLPSVVNNKHSIWDAEVGGSNPVTPTNKKYFNYNFLSNVLVSINIFYELGFQLKKTY